MPGPPPKPTALKVLEGNRGRRPLNIDEPKPAVGAAMPAYFRESPELVAEWQKHAPRLQRLGLLTEIDDGALAAICVLEVQFRELVLMGASALALSAVSRELRALWSRFGMTPADRARVKSEKPKPESKLSKFLGGGHGR